MGLAIPQVSTETGLSVGVGTVDEWVPKWDVDDRI